LGQGKSANVIWRKKYEKGKRKWGGNKRKGKETEERGKEKEIGHDRSQKGSCRKRGKNIIFRREGGI
jgi:hypothetical protein